MVSVAMATYNGERFIEKQLLSIYEQTRQPDEVIICDDGSTDHTHQIVREFISNHNLSNWTFSVNPVNLGCARNFVHAANKTSGDIIFLSDWDDVWDKDKVKIMAGLMESNPKIYALSSNKSFIDKDGNILKAKVTTGYRRNTLSKVSAFTGFIRGTKEGMLTGMVMAFRRDILELLPALYSYPGANMGHDTAIAFLADLMDGFYFYSAVLVHHRRHEANMAMNINLTLNRSIDQRIVRMRRNQYVYNIFSNFINEHYCEKEFAGKKNIFAQLSDIYKNRAENMENKKPLAGALMLRYVPKYYAFKTYLGDMVYLLNLEKLFK